MKKWRLMLAALLVACSHDEPQVSASIENGTGASRSGVAPVLSVSVQTGLRAPDPACTCASPESFPAPSKWEAECRARGATCEDVHYAEYLARKRQPGALGVLLATHYVESMVYDATISFPARGGDSTFRVRIGDIVPTPRGRARVVQVHRSFVQNWDDGYVTLHLLEPAHDARGKIFISSGAPSHVRGVAMTMMQAAAGVGTIVVADGPPRTLAVRKGDSIATSLGSVHVTDVVDGIQDGAIGWVEIDSAT